MKRNLPFLIGAFAVLAGFAAFLGWAFHVGSGLGGGWASLQPIMPFVVGGAVVVAGLAFALMWLAFYSARKGFDQIYDLDDPHIRR